MVSFQRRQQEEGGAKIDFCIPYNNMIADDTPGMQVYFLRKPIQPARHVRFGAPDFLSYFLEFSDIFYHSGFFANFVVKIPELFF